MKIRNFGQPFTMEPRNPTINDKSTIGELWINTNTYEIFILIKVVGSVFTWKDVSTGLSELEAILNSRKQ